MAEIKFENKSLGETVTVSELPEDNIWRYYQIIYEEWHGKVSTYKLWVKKPEKPKFDFKYPNETYRMVNAKQLRIKAWGFNLYLINCGILISQKIDITDFSRIEFNGKDDKPLIIIDKVDES